MAYRQLRPKKQEQEEQETTEGEISPEQMYAYLRQSTTKQTKENKESFELQLSGARNRAIKKGLDADKIIIKHEGKGKRGVSGTLRIDQRDDLKTTMADIYSGKCLEVYSYSVSRLFRDPYGVQAGTFIEACAKHHVKVFIDNVSREFDFSNEFDAFLFQLLANMAARENADRVKLLHGGNNRRIERGYYGGGPIHPGYIVDRDEDSKTCGRYIPYPPHAKVAARLYKRFRELGGQFNLIANEVGRMPVLFPPFEAWIDKRNVSQIKLKQVCKLHGKQCDCKRDNCELIGYSITKPALLRLLVAVEYAGYWKFKGELLTDEEGQPIKNHEAIIPLDDWQYAFDRLSFTTLTGEDNPKRASARTWAPEKKVEPTTLLEGIMTSPMGKVWCTGGNYIVAEMREGKLTRSNTLTVPTLWIDAPFRFRLRQRVYEDLAGNKKFLSEQLKRIQANNAEALVSVDEQIAKYQQAIANREAYIEAVGATINKEDALRLNAASTEDRAHLAALLAKKNESNKELSGIEELIDQLGRYTKRRGRFVIEGDEDTRRFIKLACESIELNEYSGHILTLTIRWRAPFAQTDVSYIYRQTAGHQPWTDAEEQTLRTLYPRADRLEIMQALPTRTWESIVSWSYLKGLKRETQLNTSGILSRSYLSLRDAQLLQEHGWKLEGNKHQHWWAIGVKDTVSHKVYPILEHQINRLIIQIHPMFD